MPMWYYLWGLSNLVRPHVAWRAVEGGTDEARFRGPAALLSGVLLSLAILFTAVADAAARDGGASAGSDMVVVYKRERSLHLLRGGERIRSYRIALGRSPSGHKVREGDSRTPEGAYVIDWRNPDSKFHRSLHISYPGPRDLLRATWLGVPPGGEIMIHGLPNGRAEHAVGHPVRDWTDGCIAVTNSEIEEIWHLVADETPVFIFP